MLAWFCAVALVATPSGAISLRQRAVLAAADEGSEGAHDPQTGSLEVEDMFALEMDVVLRGETEGSRVWSKTGVEGDMGFRDTRGI